VLIDSLGVVSVEEVVSHGRWYKHVERKDKSDWVSTCTESQVERSKCKGEVERPGTRV